MASAIPHAWLPRLTLPRQLLLRLSVPTLVCGAVLFIAIRFELSGVWKAPSIVGFCAAWFLSFFAADLSLRRLLTRRRHSFKLWVGLAAAVSGWIWLRYVPQVFDYRQIALAAATSVASVWAQRLFVRQARRTRSALSEACRWWGLTAICLWLIQPYATPHLVGGGDAHHYAQQLADAGEQARHGEFQLFVGQSAFAFNGDIHPLRTAPYFSYLGAIVSVVAGPTLSPTAIQNLFIVFSLLIATAALYGLLTRLKPALPWPAFWLTCAFASSPGILALIYSGDMVASWLTLPWLPFVFYATLHSGNAVDPKPSLCLLAGALAAIWLSHPAIAFWTTALVILPLLAPVFGHWNGGKRLSYLAACGAICAILSNYVFVSVNTLGLPSDPNLIANMRNGSIIGTLEAGWAGIGRPIDAGGSDLTRNLQLSPALWWAGFVGLLGLGAAHRHRRIAVLLFLGAGAMILLLFPSKLIAGRLWTIVPEIVIDATGEWPMQRFYPILSVLVPFLAVIAWPQTNARHGPRRLAYPALLAVLVGATLFGCFDARKFIARGYAITNSPEISDRRLRPENVLLSRYSYEYYGSVPRVFSHGTMNPLMQNRLLSRSTLEPIDLNFLALDRPIPGDGPRPRTRHKYVPADYGGSYEPPVRLEPNRVYFARFLFSGEDARGTLQLLGRYIFREYQLPVSGGPHAFGIGPQRRSGFSLWTTATRADDVQIRFYAQPGHPTPKNLGDLELLSVNPDRLPLQTLSVFPYQVSVRSQGDTWLETPKIFVEGYEARVNGRPSPVMRSPDGLAMIPVPAGRHRVHLTYVGPIVLRVAYWGTLIGWLAYVGLCCWSLRSPDSLERPFLLLGRAGITALVLVVAGLGLSQGYAALKDPSPQPDLTQGPVSVDFTLPIGLSPNWEPLWHFDWGGERWDVHLFYEGSQKIRVGLGRNGKLHAESGLFPINYLHRHRLVAQLSSKSDRSDQLKMWVNNRLIFSPVLSATKGERVVNTAPFRGKILRIIPNEGPIE